MGFDFEGRLRRLQGIMEEEACQTILLSVGSDLPYFTGYEAMGTERLTMLVVPVDDRPVMFVPRLEGPKVPDGPFDLILWDETDDPLGLVAARASSNGVIGIGDHTWSAFLVGLQNRLPGAEWRPASGVTLRLRIQKDPEEVEALRSAAHAVDRVMSRIPVEVGFAGRTELDVSRDLARLTVEEGHDVASFGIVAAGPNGASPHHEPGQRVIAEGDLVVCDFGGRFHGYFSDSTRTFVVGEPTPRQIEVHAVVAAANAAGREAVSAGVACETIDRAARVVIEDAGYGEFFIHRTGHGIGLEVHEHPYLVDGNRQTMEAGMAFSIEPGIYLPGEFGVRIEDIAVCGPDGIDTLNVADRGLVEVG
jgi:Xaa-Pro aminopeptidase